MRRTCTSPRWKGYNYTSDNLYFITTVVKNRIPCLGDLINGEMILNDFGKIVEHQWQWLADNFSYVHLHEYVIMPDHFHGIIEIKRPGFVVESQGSGLDLHLGEQSSEQVIKIKPLYDIIGAFKMTASKKIHESGFESFIWQRSFYDRIIRNDFEYFAITKYILNNPAAACRIVR